MVSETAYDDDYKLICPTYNTLSLVIKLTGMMFNQQYHSNYYERVTQITSF